MYKFIFIILAMVLLCGAVSAQDSTEVNKKYKFLVGAGAAIDQEFNTSAINSTAFSVVTETEGTLAMLIPDESFIVYEQTAPKDDKELIATKAASLMGIWKIKDFSRFSPFVSMSGTAMKTTMQSASSTDYDMNIGAGTYFKLTETIGLFVNNVFEVGEFSTYKGTIGIYLSR